jgi:uncharacterized membrane protein YphA (DoxX/SURF4 family)
MDQRLEQTWWTLRIGFGLTALLAGLDKFFGLLVDWTQYLSPVIGDSIPVTPQTAMLIVGAIEMIVGIAVLSGFITRIAAYVVAAWLLLIAIQLVTTGRFFDVAVRDVLLALGAFTLARLSEVRESHQVVRRTTTALA